MEVSANAAEIEIEDFQDLMNPRLCFQPRPRRFKVGLYPLCATTAASEIWIRRQERPAASMGAAARREVDERGKEVCGEGGREGGSEGALCITLTHPRASKVQ